jgi:hypothetical protein
VTEERAIMTVAVLLAGLFLVFGFLSFGEPSSGTVHVRVSRPHCVLSFSTIECEIKKLSERP